MVSYEVHKVKGKGTLGFRSSINVIHNKGLHYSLPRRESPLLSLVLVSTVSTQEVSRLEMQAVE